MTLAFIQEPFFVFPIIGVLVIGGIACGYPVTNWIGKIVGDYLAGAPNEKLSGPVPMMGMAATAAMRGDLNEAVALYEKFLIKSPGELQIYSRLLEIAYGPLQDQDYGDKVLSRAKRNLNKQDFRTLVELSTAIVNGQLFPLKHLGWCKSETEDHPMVEIPDRLKGQFAKKVS